MPHRDSAPLSSFQPTSACIFSLFLLLLISNTLLFFLGNTLLDSTQTGDAASGYIHLWKDPLSHPPDGTTCRLWLSAKDITKSERNRVNVLANETRDFQCNGLSCNFISSPTGGHCDVSLSGFNPNCTLQVYRQGSMDPLPDSAHLVTMGPNLGFNVLTGQPSWRDYPFMAAPVRKTSQSAVICILNDCSNLEEKLLVIRLFKRTVMMDLFGKCFNKTLTRSRSAKLMIGRYRFALLFEDFAPQGYMSPNYWTAVALGTVPIVVANADLSPFVPSDNAYLQVKKVEDVKRVVGRVSHIVNNAEILRQMVAWKLRRPSDAFMAHIDMASIRSECRLCLHVATRLMEENLQQISRPCRCLESIGSSNKTIYHIFIRERGHFKSYSIFLSSSELTISNLLKTVYKTFSFANHIPIWTATRPSVLLVEDRLRAFRVYPADVSSRTFTLQSDRQFRLFVEATPCPLLEVVFV